MFPVLSTPFAADGRIDDGALEQELDWIFQHGAKGVVTGMVSEVLKLTGAERQHLAEAVVEFNRGRGMTVISVGAESLQASLDFARNAERIKASAVMAIPPITAPLSEEQTFAFYASLIEDTRIPVVVQDASGYVGRPLSTSMQARLVNHYGRDRVFLKPEAPPFGPRLSAILAEIGDGAVVFEGSGGIGLIDSHRRGATGTMPGADLCWALSALWRALEDGDDDRAYAIGGTLALLISMLTSLDTFIAVEKHLLVKQGVFSSARMRAPSSFELDKEATAEVDRLFERLKEHSQVTQS